MMKKTIALTITIALLMPTLGHAQRNSGEMSIRQTVHESKPTKEDVKRKETKDIDERGTGSYNGERGHIDFINPCQIANDLEQCSAKKKAIK
jgi:hypothetical protein